MFIYKEYRKNEEDVIHYPYSFDELNVAKKILQEIYPLKNEYELIEKYNAVENYDVLAKRMSKADNEIDFEALWENPIARTAYFFSFKVDEADVRKRLLEFRDSLTINVLPDPTCISLDDIQLRQELTSLLSQPLRFQSLKKLIRGYYVPIPIWLFLREKDNIQQQTIGLQTFTSQDFIYTSKYGLIPV